MFINLSNVNQIKQFVELTQSCNGEILLSSGKYCVDGRSILGIFSLDLSKPVLLECEDKALYPLFSGYQA